MRHDRAMTSADPVSQPARSRSAARRRLNELDFLHEIARLATQARDWDELMRTIVDGTTAAMGVEVCSFYLTDRDADRLTLAATNGLDRFQIGRARVPFGEGVTGRVAADRRPLVIPDVKADARFLWVRGIDQRRFVASMLSVPLTWHDQVVGVLNVQTEQPRQFSDDDVAQLGAVADLLAGIIEKGRQQSEAEARVEALKAIDEARSELIALVTHELRTPLAIVRAYADLLAEEPPLRGRESRDLARRQTREVWHRSALEQIERLDRLVDSILASVRVVPEGPASVVPVDLDGLVAEVVASLKPILGRHRIEVVPSVRLQPLADPPRLHQILEHLVENAVKYAPPETAIRIDWRLHEGTVQVGVSDEGPGIPDEWRDRIFEPYARRDTHTARGSGIGLYAAKRLGESMGAHLWCEPASPHGARFVVALPAAVSV
jgi:signal transduction histidine kinase